MTKKEKKAIYRKLQAIEIVPSTSTKYEAGVELELKKSEWRIKFGDKWVQKTLFDLCFTGE